MKPKPNEEAQRWFKQAQNDIDDARFNAGGKRYNLACFLSQQSAEKAIKAFLYSVGCPDIWGHSVADLCEISKKYNKEFTSLKKKIAVLDKYYVPTRYPNGLPGGLPSEAFDEIDAGRAISLTEQVLDFIKRRLQDKAA